MQSLKSFFTHFIRQILVPAIFWLRECWTNRWMIDCFRRLKRLCSLWKQSRTAYHWKRSSPSSSMVWNVLNVWLSTEESITFNVIKRLSESLLPGEIRRPKLFAHSRLLKHIIDKDWTKSLCMIVFAWRLLTCIWVSCPWNVRAPVFELSLSGYEENFRLELKYQ
jgi:hypothetical protein